MEKRIISYDLEISSESTDAFYEKIQLLGQKVIADLQYFFGSLSADYIEFIKKEQIEKPRTAVEYQLELLTMGVLWTVYGKQAFLLEQDQAVRLTEIVERRKMAGEEKPYYNKLKGKYSTEFLFYPEKEKERLKEPDFNLNGFHKLLCWLRASGEFEQEVKRLTNWYRYFLCKDTTSVENWMRGISAQAIGFQKLCEQELGKYTTCVEGFRRESEISYQGREDILLAARSEVEYHLNMVGAQILNIAFRKAFLQAEKTYIYLPACMMKQKDGGCRAVKKGMGFLCAGCTEDCPVHRVTNIGKKYGAVTVIVYHESELNHTRVSKEQESTGVVGIACVLNLLSGGWKAKDLGYIPQCVLLNYCGCRQHWSEEGIVTRISEKRLEELLKK
ncbi:DUF116 domain-containing protein [Anaeromicropila populeti]|uniref:DUF116 domain-containing protein n=1 Tax=Anaeromicropila populeti TaxID=37658 RepID=A0A1I6JWI3_9FIRM|nr:DUF116 domain-containing protein [Anaeromicropila populeti]SFR83354.1 Protein of unknown function DUF116 [Anaeromicropila populeti]